jgi:hypothetical protein
VNPFAGLRVIEVRWMTITAMVPPTHRFVKYEASDMWWLEKYGFLVPAQVPDPRVAMMPGTIMGHPETIRRLREAVKQPGNLSHGKLS